MCCDRSNCTPDMAVTVTQSNYDDLKFFGSTNDILNYEIFKYIEEISICGFSNSFFLIGAPANLLTMIVFYRQGLRDRMNLCLFCLAFADLLLLVSYALMAAYCYIGVAFPEQKEYWRWFFLQHGLSFKFGFSHSSGCVTMIIAVERCVCVMFPMKAATLISTKTMAIILLVTFIIIQLLCSVYIIKYNLIVHNDGSTGVKIASLSITELYRNHTFFSIIENIVLSFISFMNFIVVFLSAVITVVQLHKAMAWRKGTTSSYLKGQAVLVRMLVAVSCIFLVCTAPTIILALVRFAVFEFRADGRYSNLFLATHYILYLPFLLNSSINFFVYVKMSSRFRRELQSLCLCIQTQEPQESVVASVLSHARAEH